MTAGPGASEPIVLDRAQQFQTVQGWETTPEFFDGPDLRESLSPEVLDKLMDRLLSEVGITRVRLEIRSGAEAHHRRGADMVAGRLTYENYKPFRYAPENDNDDPNLIDPEGFDFAELDWSVETWVLPLRQKLEAIGQPLWINLCYVSFRDGMYIHRNPEEYAEFVLAVHLHLKEKYGLDLNTWEVILEPDLPKDGWTGTEIGQAIVAAADRLEAAGFSTTFVAPSVTDMANTVPYLDAIVAVPGAAEHLSEVSYHRYRHGTAATLRDLERTATKLGLPTAMLEWWFGLATYHVLHADLAAGGAAWQGRTLLTHFQAVETQGASAPLARDVVANSLYFRNIRPGAQRIGANTPWHSALDPLAFVNPDGRLALVAIARRGTEVTIQGADPGRYRLEIVSDDQGRLPVRQIEIGPDPLVFEMPSRGVFALTGPLTEGQAP